MICTLTAGSFVLRRIVLAIVLLILLLVELFLLLAWLAGAVALGLRLDKACKQAGRWGEAAHHFFSSVIWLLLGIGFMKQAPGICNLCGVLGVVYAVVYAVCGVRAAGEARRNEENGRE